MRVSPVKTRRVAVTTVLVLVLVAAVGGVAAAKLTKPQRTAKAAATGFVKGYLPDPGKTGLCDVAGLAGFLRGKKVYRASCHTNDGAFTYAVYVNATKGSFNAKQASKDAVKTVYSVYCPSGVIYATGVQGKFFEVFGGKGSGVAVAKATKAIAASQESKVAGYSPATLCG